MQDCDALDYQGTVEVLAATSTTARKRWGGESWFKFPDQCAIDPVYVSKTLDPVRPMFGPALLPDRTFAEATEQFDIILIPGGAGALPGQVDPALIEFVKKQGPGAEHILTVCNGTYVLAATGLLDGFKATTNKSLYKLIVEATKDRPITWVPKARWVANDDKKIWTSSGVTAGLDMAKAFIAYLTTEDYANEMASIIELRTCEEGDDPFAAVYGLV